MGADLIQSPQGPWIDSVQRPVNTQFRPVTLAASVFTFGPQPQENYIVDDERKPVNLHQSATLLSRNYGTSLNQQLIATDPVYALSELFAFICASEAQYLDMIRSVLDDNVASIHNECVKNMTDIRAILVFQSEGQQRTTFSAVSLVIHNYEFLLRRTNELMTRCDHEWNVLMSQAAVDEAQWSRNQSRSQHKFTVLASVYLPLSVSCSVFGMTFFTLGSLREGFTLWIVVTVLLFLFSLVMLLWDQNYVKRSCIRFVLMPGKLSTVDHETGVNVYLSQEYRSER